MCDLDSCWYLTPFLFISFFPFHPQLSIYIATTIQTSPRNVVFEVSSLSELESLQAVGQGASGVVQKTRHIPTGTILALKVVPVNLSEKKMSTNDYRATYIT